MPSKTIATNIQKKLVDGERAEDAEFMFDALLGMRADLDISTKDNATIVQRLLCFLAPAKPQSYMEAMHAFRMEFHGIASDVDLQRHFRDSVAASALTLVETDPKKIQWDATRYFKREAMAAGA